MNFPPVPLEEIQADNIITETNINHSIKISKQVLKAKLTEQKTKTSENIDKEYSNARNVLSQSIVEKNLRAEFKKQFNTDSGFNYFRLGLNNFLNTKHRTNWSLVLSDNLNAAARRIAAPMKHDLSYEKLLNKKTINIGFYTVIGTLPKNGNEDDECDNSWQYELAIPPKLYKEMVKVNQYLCKAKAFDELYEELENKLRNLDTVMEELEAKILIKELETTVNGRQILDLTSSMISEVLGENLLLTLK